MQPLGRKDMGLNQLMNWLQGRGTRADLIVRRRQTEVDPLSGIALTLAIERLMLGELLAQDHRQKAGPGKASRRHMQGCWRLRNLLAFAAGELLPHGLNDLPLTRDDLQGLGDILTELRQLCRAAVGTTGWGGDNDTFARQVLAKGFA